jgi:hypothetical protein
MFVDEPLQKTVRLVSIGGFQEGRECLAKLFPRQLLGLQQLRFTSGSA